MLLSSLLLLLCAAVFHAIANALMKRSRDKIAFGWWMLGVFCLLASPVLFQFPKAEAFGWWLVLISGLLEAIYFVTLARAYTAGDLSQVYPIARGSAPLFLLMWAILFLHERPTPIGVCGIVSVVAGLYIVNLPSLSAWSQPLHTFRSSASGWAMLTGLLISVYSAVDKVGVRYFSPLVYLYFILLVSWLTLSVQWFFPSRRLCLMNEVRRAAEDTGNPRMRILAAAVFGTTGYLLVLAAMRISPVSYVGPVREVSVIFGGIIGVRFLREQGGSLRIAGSVLIALGIVLIAVFG